MPVTDRLREVSGLTGETVPASGLAIRSGWYPAIRSTSLMAAPEGGSVVHNARGTGAEAASMEGSATYRCVAAGVWTTVDSSGGRITSARAGEFTAEATRRANFFGASDAGVVNGEIAAFRDAGGRSLAGWRVTLDSARLRSGSASFSGGTEGALGAGTIGAGSWEGTFHGSGGASDARPGHVTGRFDARFPGANVAGAFGAARRNAASGP